MKKIGLALFAFLCITYLSAQENYVVNGKKLQLKTEVEGTLDLLWGVIDGRFHYYVRTSDNTITELINTKSGKRHFEEEYKDTLENLTHTSAKNVTLSLVSLKVFIDDYNATQDPNYERLYFKTELELLLEVFGGITNSPFVYNANNAILSQFGTELELDAKGRTRHVLFMRFRHVFKSNDFEYSTTELALGYRFRLITSKTLNLFVQTKFATLNFVKNTVPGPNNVPVDISETGFEIPLTFGIGTDIRITEQSFLTIRYNELFAALIQNQDHFSTNLTLGYKFNL